MYYVYLVTNSTNNILYCGVTNDLKKRSYQHKNEHCEGFSKKYKTNKLVYFECYANINDAISREKQIKSWRRTKKNDLINSKNPNWSDLYSAL